MSKTAKKGRKGLATPRKPKPRTMPPTPYEIGQFLDRLVANKYADDDELDERVAWIKKMFRRVMAREAGAFYEQTGTVARVEDPLDADGLERALEVCAEETPGIETFGVCLMLPGHGNGALDPMGCGFRAFLFGGKGSTERFARPLAALVDWCSWPDRPGTVPEPDSELASYHPDRRMYEILGA